jgi:flagellar motor switch protein FliM
MVDEVELERTAKIVSFISQANAAKREAELKPLMPLFDGLATTLVEILQVYAKGPVKSSVSALGIENLRLADLASEGRTYLSSAGNLTTCLRTERAFDALLCEICFGGSGSQPEDSEEKGRPASRIESFLRKMVLDSVFERLPALFQDITKLKFSVRGTDQGKSTVSDQQLVACAKASILINVFSMSAELEILFPTAEVDRIVGQSSPERQRDDRSFGAVLGDCQFEILVALPPHEVGLHEVLNLSVGSMLKLPSTPDDLSYLTVEGVLVGKGRLDIAADRLGVTIQ